MSDTAPLTSRLDQAVAEYLAAVESGAALDRQETLARYADVAADLEQFFADHDRFTNLAEPVRSLVAGSSDTPRQNSGSDATLAVDAAAHISQRHERDSSDSFVERIGDYEILRELGRGGMGVVYQARHTSLNRIVALKTILAGQHASLEDLNRFLEEAKAAAALDHPGIVPIYEIGQHNDQPFFSMAFVEGPSLSRVLEDGPLPPHVAVRIFRKIVEAVAYAHAKGVIHRDLKPANILLAGEHARDRKQLDASQPKITDFGLAKLLDSDSNLTASGQLLGTPLYMSPEQAAGRVREIGPASDIYSLGAILYVLLTGRPPFASDNPVEVILRVLESEPTLPRQLRPGVPRDLECICLKCLEKQSADRYTTADLLADDLDRFLRQEPVEARSPTIGQRFRRWMRRQPVLAWHVVCLGALLVFVQGIFALHPDREIVYHLVVSGLIGALLAVACACQWFQSRSKDPTWLSYFWMTADAALITALLARLVAPLGPLLSSFLALICVSGLFFQTRLVAFTTAMTVLASLLLFTLRPEEAHPLHYAFCFETTLIIAGLVVGYQVWRLSVLREFYDDRRVR
jgi:eukaryotic-like serine/threonine-protein kinase